MNRGRRTGDRRQTVRRQSQPSVVIDGMFNPQPVPMPPAAWPFPIISKFTLCGNCGVRFAENTPHRCAT